VYQASLNYLNKASAYCAAFLTVLSYHQRRIHQTQLPDEPSNWSQMLRHGHRAGFEAAAKAEYETLETRDTFTSVPESEANGAFIIPVMWVCTHKFDEDGFVTKYKARVVVRGDLQQNQLKDTYAATLAAKPPPGLNGKRT
jgi:hypothetical protein